MAMEGGRVRVGSHRRHLASRGSGSGFVPAAKPQGQSPWWVQQLPSPPTVCTGGSGGAARPHQPQAGGLCSPGGSGTGRFLGDAVGWGSSLLQELMGDPGSPSLWTPPGSGPPRAPTAADPRSRLEMPPLPCLQGSPP